jgi:predicted nucleic-acid-binding protein
MKASIDTNILIQYIVKSDKKSVESILEYIKKYDKFIISQPVFLETIFILQKKSILSRNQIDEEIFCLTEDPLFEFVLDFDIYLFLSLYTSYTGLDITDLYLLIKSKEIETITLDLDLSKKIKTVTF